MASRIIFSADNFELLARSYPVGFPCLTCSEGCCTDYLIFVTHADVSRIHGAVPELRVLDYLDVSDVAVDDYPEVMLDGRPCRLVLKKEPASGRCVFLASGVNLCAIHAVSPYICRMYPFQVPYDDYQELELRQEVKCPERFLCPRDEIPQLIRTAKAFWERDLPRYAQLVETWHRLQPEGSLASFAEFLLSSSRGGVAAADD